MDNLNQHKYDNVNLQMLRVRNTAYSESVELTTSIVGRRVIFIINGTCKVRQFGGMIASGSRQKKLNAVV